ncbi:MAG TPA: hypothetical protein VJS44_12260 [Pyrinomonadaceae bacterium]|nr:hypothetical protein [Pyrinomonadaceae bacterium]
MKNHRLEILLFLSVWLVCGLTINSRNLEAFALQQMGVEAIVERGTFYLEGSSIRQLQPGGDVFDYDGHKYAAKQPGQFMAGAIVYFLLHLFGLSYARDYLLASALVTFFTASMVTALSTVALYRMLVCLVKDGASVFWPLSAALLYAFATTAFAYAGIAHHDALASGFVTIAFYFAFRAARGREGVLKDARLYLCAGLFLGLTVTTSMLAFWPALAVFLYLLSLKRWRLLPYLLLGGLLGLAPLFIYDWVNFGNPFKLPNLAGNYSDTFFHLDAENFRAKLGFYLEWTMHYTPVLLIGFAGLWLLPQGVRREKWAAAGAVLILCAYIFNIDTIGDCQYGPRYLLPTMSFGCLGLAGFSHLESRALRRVWITMIAVVGSLSFLVNAVGALQGAMYCTLARHAFPLYLTALMRGEWGSFPLFSWLVIPALISACWLLRLALQARRAAERAISHCAE